MGFLTLGIDVGSVAVAAALIGADRRWRESFYAFHRGDPAGALARLLGRLDFSGGVRVAATGAAAGVVAHHGSVDGIIALIAGGRAFHPGFGAILQVGGERLALVEFDAAGGATRTRTHSSCAAGTGGFLDQQARRLNLAGAEELAAIALESGGPPPRIATRCAVFAKTDLAHAQQEGYSLAQICDGLCLGVARHIVETLVGGEPLGRPLLMSGGVARNRAVVRHLGRLLGAEPICERGPLPAAGAALALLAEPGADERPPFRSIEEIIRCGPRPRAYAFAPLELRASRLPDFDDAETYRFARPGAVREAEVEVELFSGFGAAGAGECLLGVDVGSTSTKAVLVDGRGAVLAGVYTRTAGRPVAALKGLLAALADAARRRGAGAIAFAGAAATGAGRKLAGGVLGADLVLDEVSAHARAAVALTPAVDTIIEIGGQDSKFTTLKAGRVDFCLMNTVCAAGTGSFIEEQAERLGFSLAGIAAAALGAPAPLASDRCTVFMERDINHLLAEGYAPREILATALHSVAENYLGKVACEPRIGRVVCFQGATARNAALVAAFEQRLGRPILVSRFCHLAGALGAALALADAGLPEKTRFRGLGLARLEIPTRVEICGGCANHCKITVAEVGGERAASGFLCGREDGASRRAAAGRAGFDLLAERARAFARPGRRRSAAPGPRVGIPSGLHLAEDHAAWRVFFDALSIPTVTDPRAGEAGPAGRGAAGAEFCAPLAALRAEVERLLAAADFVFLPYYLEHRTADRSLRRQTCYYTQYAPALCAGGEAAGRVLTPLVHYLYGTLHAERQLWRMVRAIGRRRVGFLEVRRAYAAAREFKAAALSRLRARYREETAGAAGIHAVLLGRPYTVLARRMNKGIPEIFAALGVKAFFQEMLPAERPPSAALAPLLGEIHWRHGAEILRAAETAALTPGAYPVLVTAFRCAPDAFVIDLFGALMEAHRKPYLVLQLDRHGSSVGYETRIEAAVRAFENHFASGRREKTVYPRALTPRATSTIGGRTLWLPDWDHLSFRLIAANLRREGIDARLLPETPDSIRRSLRTNSGQCLPVNIVARNFIEAVEREGQDPARALLWMARGAIACNLRMYPHFAQSLLERRGGGFERAQVYLGSISFAEISMRLPVETYLAYMLGGMLRRIGCRLRPYETAAGATDAAIAAAIAGLEAAFEAGRGKEAALRAAVERLAAVPTAAPPRPRPKVAVFGDLYARDNEVLNQGLIGFIERHGGEVVTLPYSSYAKMVAGPYIRKWFIEGDFRDALTTGALMAAVTRLEKRYLRILAPLLAEAEPVYDEPPGRILARFGLRPEHTGESMDNALKVHYLVKHHPDLALFVQASPAFCCPALVTEALSARIEAATGVPIVSITYDGIGGGKNEALLPYLKYPRRAAGHPLVAALESRHAGRHAHP
jgi:predicted CoA-substrate-specific enzyme activase